ncbi:MAG: aminotransferase class V-fold PLP-dependent enzyme [Firmicutes bacterium]|nr:aminotransferase class V-fold PLP-dependent enzyme [Bacillota bacterium]
MIYFDNSATSLIKPETVSKAVAYAIDNFGSAGRSFYDAGLKASREIYLTRQLISELVGLKDPLNVAFTSSATEALNLVIQGLVSKSDSVITTVTEHNSVIRPLRLVKSKTTFLDCDDMGNVSLESFEDIIKNAKTKDTKFFVCNHGSNVTGNILDAKKFYEICKRNNIVMILDISQTIGTIKIDMDMADIFCFTSHKGLFGPQGVGGIIVKDKHDFKITKSGGAGGSSFDEFQSVDMPDIFEVGTLNSHSIYGLQKGVEFILEIGQDKIYTQKKKLAKTFYDGIKNFKNITIYGDFENEVRLPLVSLNIKGLTASEVSEKLWTNNKIATRAGVHCAPLLHRRLGTSDCGMTRFSFSYFNTMEEIEKGIKAVKEIINF